MKVVLFDSIDGLGNRGEIVTVSDGYARNYLIPKGKATLANSGAEALAESVHKSWLVKNAKDKQVAEEIADKFNNINLSIPVKVSKDGKLFGSVGDAQIAEVLTAETGFEFERKMIDLENPIKQVGDFQINVLPHPEVNFMINLSIVED